jgi:hypothetical protein
MRGLTGHLGDILGPSEVQTEMPDANVDDVTGRGQRCYGLLAAYPFGYYYCYGCSRYA